MISTAMNRRLLLLLLLLLPTLAASCSSCPEAPSTELAAPPGRGAEGFEALREKLASVEAATRAWGAWDAGEQGARGLVPELAAALRLALGDRSDEARTFELCALLDALIRLDARIAADDLARVSRVGSLRTQALVLAARDPEAHADALVAMRAGSRWLERVAIDNLLAAGAPRRAAEFLLPAARVRIIVNVTDGHGGRGGGGRSTGIGCGSLRAPEGFPPTVLYELVDARRTSATLFADGPRPIGFERAVHHEREFGVGGHIEQLDETDHALRLLRWIVKDRAKESVLASAVTLRHSWKDRQTYLDTVGPEIEARVKAWKELVGALVEAGHLDALSVPAQDPIEVVVEDDRQDRSVDLPPLGR